MSDTQFEPIGEPDLATNLTQAEKSLRDRFVTEYLKDYDKVQAAIRVGYTKMIAQAYCERFLSEPYVLQQIRLRECDPEEESEDAIKKKVTAGLQREANYFGPGCSASARVAALAKLAAINGMDAPIRTKNEITMPTGAGMFVVPGLMSIEDWEKLAEQQQAELVKPSNDVADTSK